MKKAVKIQVILILAGLFLLLQPALAIPIIHLDSVSSNYIGKYTSVWTDRENKLSVHDIINKTESFSISHNDIYYTSPGPATHWIHFKVKNAGNKKFYLVIDNPTVKELDVYCTTRENGISTLFKSDSTTTFSNRKIKANNFQIPLTLSPNDTVSFFIKYRSVSPAYLPIKFVIADELIEHAYKNILFYGFFYGIFIFAFLYNFFIYLVTLNKSYLYYIITVFFVLLYQSWSFGHLFQFVLAEYPEINQCIYLYIASIMGIVHISFVREFLGTHQRIPKWHKKGFIVQLLFLLVSFIAPFNSYTASSFAAFAATCSVFYSIISGIIVYNRGYKPARFYIIGHGLNFICVIIFIIKGFGYIPHTFLSQNIMAIGVGLEIITLSFALGDSFKKLRQEREEVQRKLNEELNQKIIERTKAQQELEQVNKHLIQINADLDNFIYVASHNLKGPVASIEGLINIYDQGLVEPNEYNKFFGMIRTSVGKLKNTIMDLTEISRLQTLDKKEDICDNLLQEIINEVMSDMDYMLKEPMAIIQIPETPVIIRFSKENLKRVIYNLINNAINFKHPERPLELCIGYEETEKFRMVSIQDNGIGISDMIKPKIFSMFKRGHSNSGRGVGLYIVKRIMKNNKGKVDFESQEDVGSLFRLYFPKE